MKSRLASLLWVVAIVACHGQDDSVLDAAPATVAAPAQPAQGPQGWRLTFYDEFNGPGTSGIGSTQFSPDCWDAAVHPVHCAWERGKSDPCNTTPLRGPGGVEPVADLSHLEWLNKCVWTVYDQFSYWGTAAARFQPERVGFVAGPGQPGNYALALETTLGGSGADPDTDKCGKQIAAPWPHAGRGCPITSGAIQSRRFFDNQHAIRLAGAIQREGRFEIRAKLPSGRGAFPAHWLQSNSGGWIDAAGCGHRHYGEVDIMEWTPWRPGRTIGSMHYGYDRPTDCAAPTDPALAGSFSTDHDPGDTRFTDDFHTYAVEWEDGEVRIEVDGLRYARYVEGQAVSARDNLTKLFETVGAHLPDEEMFLILNTSIDASDGLDVHNLVGFATMTHEIDYVRFYQRCDLASLDPECHATTPTSRIMTDDAGMSGVHIYDAAGDQPAGPQLWSSALRELAVLDVDGDGLDDLLLRNRATAGHSTYLLRGQPSGDFATRVVVDTAWGMSPALWAADRRALRVVDHNGDGCDDVLLIGATSSDASYLLTADCAGGFLPAQLVTTAWGMTSTLWDGTRRIALVGDYNGDGRGDVLMQSLATTDATYVLYGATTGGFATRVDVSTQAGMLAALWAGDLRRATVGDFDGDGKDDVLLRNRPTSGHASYLVRGGATGFVYRQVIDTVAGMSRVAWADDLRTAAVGDFDGDGKDDVLLRNRTASESGYLVRGGGGGFVGRAVLDTLGGMNRGSWADRDHAAAVGDFDGDGRADVVLQPRTKVPLDPAAEPRTFVVPGVATTMLGARADVTDDQAMSAPLWSADHHRLVVARVAATGRAAWVLQPDGTRNTAALRLDANHQPVACGDGSSGQPAPCEWHDAYQLYWRR